ncbi:autotransporter assembly complex protein TamA [Sphingomonas nostoxanthinifaciens]|uniref:autotransporter assembly complex protein TamA n=1 Tax=Sphingomonas nostoxanthinifaciens TaxID=2872652 RepID=UPI001CC200F2|nr:BamA/TamA family outer membrane protein [Sphingomonas nostoxanthinifaciens]
MRAAIAQTPAPQSPASVDPAADLAPLPGLGVDWPDPARIDAVLATPGQQAAPANAGKQASGDRIQRYRVRLEGADDLPPAFRTRFNQLSALVANESKPANAAQLDRRAHDDEDLVRQLLRAAGYYDGLVTSKVEVAPDGTATSVALSVQPGPAYHFAAVTLPGLDAAGHDADTLRAQFRVHPGDAVDADAVLAATVAYRADLGRRGFPFAKVAEPQVKVDHASHQASLSLAVTPGPRARFGRIVPVGPRPIFTAHHLQDIARFRPGDAYDAGRLDDFRRALIATGLVSVATITPVTTADPGVVDISVRIDRAPPRTVSGQLGYGTGQGARVALSWEHRNLIKPEGAVTFSGVGGTQEQSLGATLRRGNFYERDRILTAQVVASHTNYDAYDARTFTVGGSIERQTNIIWQKEWAWSVGTEFVATDERETGAPDRHTYLVAAAPSSLGYDGTDDLLNPSRGFRLAGRVSPEVSLENGTTLYVKAQFDASAYQPVGHHVVLAGRIRFGALEGASLESIAPSRRFYSGGGGSIRGFSYQAVGPRDQYDQPIGGRSLTEFGTEVRVRFGNFGLVPFLDGGNLYRTPLPSFSSFRFGTGLGVRYYSSFGPIRVDVGTPIARRPGESLIGVYVSLGQAF